MNRKRLLELADQIIGVQPSGRRSLIAIAGAPASGKSHLARDLVDELNSRGAGAVIVPMDGFHLDNVLLETRGLLARKGAPETFDALGFIHAMERLKTEEEVILPTFDRDRDLSVAGAIAIGPQDRIAVVEGNYLCFSEAPWDRLAGLWDLSCYLDIPETILLERLVRRWINHDHTPEEAEARARGNDLANAHRIAGAVGKVDKVI
ncbi:hypothetical protein [Aliiruegeria sabulilitoris]|uniref:hypothetical protein n=1 Tax=Aliiruegeria sabulilitoris TaxID=1510458 RepID=UPI0008343CE7|nr:hypothetical protein [Aliiruegeria sabulilitoris]NDR57285.1 nucleoside/nucleotide kinase family protein [Pseudoruegeria sp. M32A2M]